MSTETAHDPREVYHVALLPRAGLTIVEYLAASATAIEYADEHGRNATPDMTRLAATLDISEGAVRLAFTSLVGKGRLIETAPGTFDLALPDAVRRRGESFIRRRDELHTRTGAGWEPTEDELNAWWSAPGYRDHAVAEASWHDESNA